MYTIGYLEMCVQSSFPFARIYRKHKQDIDREDEDERGSWRLNNARGSHQVVGSGTDDRSDNTTSRSVDNIISKSQ